MDVIQLFFFFCSEKSLLPMTEQLARTEGFEPSTPGLESGLLPITCKPALMDETGFEPVLSVLQTAALPLELFVRRG